MISIIYSSNRVEPKFDWFLASLYHQTTAGERADIEIVFVDYCKPIRLPVYCNEFNIIHVEPKPNIYQGALRKTKGEYFSPCNARNTGILMSTGDYLVFVDDVSVLMPTWYAAVTKAYNHNKITCGAYKKHFEMVVQDGILMSSREHGGGIDSRWGMGDDNHPVRIQGTQLFGCSFCCPVEAMLKVNGFDEICDSVGGEDYHLGIRLQNAGYEIWYDRKMFTIESEELHNQPYLMRRDDRVLEPNDYMDRLNFFGLKKRETGGNFDSSHLILDVLLGLRQVWTIGNGFDISKDRLHKTIMMVEDRRYHWFDLKPLNEML